jgi:hypothetical protein
VPVDEDVNELNGGSCLLTVRPLENGFSTTLLWNPDICSTHHEKLSQALQNNEPHRINEAAHENAQRHRQLSLSRYNG